MAVTAFFSCARAQEVSSYDKPAFRNHLKYSRRSSVIFTASSFSVGLPYMKNDALFTGSRLFFSLRRIGPLATILHLYLRLRDTVHGSHGVLWLRQNGVVPTLRWFVERLKQRCGNVYTGHSLRSGGATLYALIGTPERLIKRLGRWSSSAWEDYVRTHSDVAVAVLDEAAGGAPSSSSLTNLPLSFDDSALRAILT
jgi:hypothetical protein